MSSLPVTYEMVRHSAEINTYIQQADASLIALGFTCLLYTSPSPRDCS